MPTLPLPHSWLVVTRRSGAPCTTSSTISLFLLLLLSTPPSLHVHYSEHQAAPVLVACANRSLYIGSLPCTQHIPRTSISGLSTYAVQEADPEEIVPLSFLQ